MNSGLEFYRILFHAGFQNTEKVAIQLLAVLWTLIVKHIVAHRLDDIPTVNQVVSTPIQNRRVVDVINAQPFLVHLREPVHIQLISLYQPIFQERRIKEGLAHGLHVTVHKLQILLHHMLLSVMQFHILQSQREMLRTPINIHRGAESLHSALCISLGNFVIKIIKQLIRTFFTNMRPDVAISVNPGKVSVVKQNVKLSNILGLTTTRTNIFIINRNELLEMRKTGLKEIPLHLLQNLHPVIVPLRATFGIRQGILHLIGIEHFVYLVKNLGVGLLELSILTQIQFVFLTVSIPKGIQGLKKIG